MAPPAAFRPSSPRARLAAVALAATWAALAPAPARADEAKRVLVLHSYHHDYPWTDMIQEGISRTLAQAFPGVVLHVEFMNTKRHDPRTLAGPLVALYQTAYAGAAFDVIIASDDNALDFLLRHRERLFPGVPVVFCGINDLSAYRLDPAAGYTGVSEAPDLESTIAVALRLHPGTRTLAIISDNTETGEINLGLARRAAARFPGLGLVELRRLTAAQLVERLGRLGPDTVVLNVSFIRDADGRTFTPRASMELVVKASPRPVYTCWDYNMAPGAMGGKVLSGRLQGERAAELAIRILRGEPAGALPVVESPTAYLFDDAGLRRFGIDEASLPPGAVVTGRPDTLYDRYRTWIWLGAALFALQAAIIGLLLWTIAGRRREEAARRELEGRYRGIVRNASEGIFQATLDGRLLSANPALARILGFGSPEALLAEADELRRQLLVEPGDRDELVAAMRAGAPALTRELQVRRRDGQRIWVLLSSHLVRDREGTPQHVEGSVIDISERRQAESEVKAGRNFLETLLNAIPVPVFYKDGQGRYLGFNQAFERFYGRSRPELVGKSVFDVSPRPLAEAYHARDLEVLQSPAIQVYESQVVTASGAVREVVFHKAQFHDGEGQVAGLIGVILDITERKQADAENQALQRQLLQAQKLESVGRLAGGVAHDFNNMLAVIFMELELIKAELQPGSALEAHVLGIEQAAERSRDVTRQLLAFSRKQPVAPRAVDLNALVAGLQKSLARLIGEDVEIRLALAEGLGQVRIDPTQVDQILVNLVVNARDAMPAGGTVVIETGHADLDEAACAGRVDWRPGSYVTLAVSDTGCGMDAATLQHIFEPFFTTKEVGKGTGLGLATVFGIVKQNHGAIEVQSEPGRGSRFVIALPRLPAQPTQAAAAAEGPPPTGHERILLVEDDPMLAAAARKILEALGYRVLTAAGADEALAVLTREAGRVDLVLSDVVMPGMDGARLRDRVAAAHPGVRVVLMSGHTPDAVSQRGVLDGDLDFIQKPFSVATLSRTVRRVLDRPRA